MSIKLKELEVVIQLTKIFPDLPLNMQNILNQWANQLKGQVQSSMVNIQSPPEAARISMISQNLLIHVALNRLSLHLLIPENLQVEKFKNMNSLLQEFKPAVDTFLKLTKETKGHVFVLSKTHFPTKLKNPTSEIVSKLVENFIKTNNQSNPLNFNLTLGYQESSLAVNYTFRNYETRKIVIPPGMKPDQGFFNIQRDQLPLMETGVEVLIDLNNSMNPAADFSFQIGNLINKTKSTVENVPFLYFEDKLSEILLLPDDPLMN